MEFIVKLIERRFEFFPLSSFHLYKNEHKQKTTRYFLPALFIATSFHNFCLTLELIFHVSTLKKTIYNYYKKKCPLYYCIPNLLFLNPLYWNKKRNQNQLESSNLEPILVWCSWNSINWKSGTRFSLLFKYDGLTHLKDFVNINYYIVNFFYWTTCTSNWDAQLSWWYWNSLVLLHFYNLPTVCIYPYIIISKGLILLNRVCGAIS